MVDGVEVLRRLNFKKGAARQRSATKFMENTILLSGCVWTKHPRLPRRRVLVQAQVSIPLDEMESQDLVNE